MKMSCNKLIAKLTKEEQKKVESFCQLVTLRAGEIIGDSQARECSKIYFLCDASVVLMLKSDSGHALGVGIIGAEGAIGLGAALGSPQESWSYWVQTGGCAWPVNRQAWALLLQQNPNILMVMAKYISHMSTELASMSMMIQFGHINSRLAHWLILSSERSQSMQLSLTHQYLALILGVRRVSITEAVNELKCKGFIGGRRGVIDVLDIRGLIGQTLRLGAKSDRNCQSF